MNQFCRAVGSIAAMTAALSASLPVTALAAPRSLRQIIGMRQSEASDFLHDRGYRFAEDAGRREAAWWNDRDRECVIVSSSRGRVSDLVDARASRCGQKDNTGKIVAGALIAGAVVAAAAASAEKARRQEEAERRGEYAPAKGITCWRVERVCNDSRGYSQAWTDYEFPAPTAATPRR